MVKINKSLKKKSMHAPQVLNDPIHYVKPVSFSRGIRVDLGECTFLFISGTASVDNNGKTVEDLKDIKGFGNKIIENLKEYFIQWKNYLLKIFYIF